MWRFKSLEAVIITRAVVMILEMQLISTIFILLHLIPISLFILFVLCKAQNYKNKSLL